MIKTIFSYIIFYISCVNARQLTYATGMEGPHYLRHRYLTYATGMEGPHYLRHRHLAYATGIEGPRNLKHSEDDYIIYDNYY